MYEVKVPKVYKDPMTIMTMVPPINEVTPLMGRFIINKYK